MNARPRSARSYLVALAACGLVLATPAHGTRDPMRPPVAATGRAAPRAVPAPALTAVIGTAERRVAIVNGRVVRAGDTVEGAVIVAVLEDGIRYSRAGATRELRLPGAPAVKRPARSASGGPGSAR